jgi:hypothetical protein
MRLVMTFRRANLLCTWALVCAGLLGLPGPASATTAARLIRAGIGVGPVQLGGTLDDAIRAWGTPTDRLPTDFQTMYGWEPQGLGIVIDNPTGAIREIQISNSRVFATAGGIMSTAGPKWLGSTPKQVRQEFGPPPKPYIQPSVANGLLPATLVWSYRCRGITFFFDKHSDLWYVSGIVVKVPEDYWVDSQFALKFNCKTGTLYRAR